MTQANPIDPIPSTAPPRRRRWPWILLALIGLLTIVIVLLPVILSLGVVKQVIVARMNRNLHGRLEIADWSIGWTGSELRNLRVFDANQAEVLSVARLRTSLSLVDALRRNFDLGPTEIEEPNFTQLVMGRDGSTNLQEVFQSPSSAAAGHPFSGDFAASRLRATIVDRRDETTVIVEPSVLTMQIKSGRDSVAYQLTLNVRTSGGTDRSKHEGIASLPDVLAQLSDERLPIGAAALAGSDAILNALGRRSTTRPSTRQAASRPIR